MENWDREKLYEEVWDAPVSRVAIKYGISDVMVSKVCRKLSIPLPGRGYWARKAAGQVLKKQPLPKLKNVPIVQRFKALIKDASRNPAEPPAPDPTDPQFLRIRHMESRIIDLSLIQVRHKMVSAAEKRLAGARPDSDGILRPRGSGPCLDIRVSAGTLDRALRLMNAMLLTLEEEGFPVTVGEGVHGTAANIFGHSIRFAIFERLQVTGRREVGEGIWKKKVVDHAFTGNLELRMGDFAYGSRIRDRKKHRLESVLPQCVARLIKLGRDRVLEAEEIRLREIERRRREEERWKLAEEIRKEEERVKQLEDWVTSWSRAKDIRDFLAALAALWVSGGEDISPESPRSQRLKWMRQQADRLDPLVESPPSILDKKR